MIHCGLQADLMAMTARVDACLHILAVIRRHDKRSPFFVRQVVSNLAGQKSVREDNVHALPRVFCTIADIASAIKIAEALIGWESYYRMVLILPRPHAGT
jgi:hypothetical protein